MINRIGRLLTSKRVCVVVFLFLGYTAQSLAQVSNCVVPPANALLNTNNSVNTCGVFDTIDPADQHVIGLIDVASAVADAAGNGIAPRTDAADVTATTGMTKNPAWLIGNLGNLYGVSIDEETAEFYAAASSNYASSYGFGTSQRDAILNYGTLGGGDNAAGAGAIYKFDAVTGNPSLFATLPQATVSYTALNCEARAYGTVTTLPATGDQARTNVGVGLGNIVWDNDRDQMFAVNWEDGRIYRLDASGAILDAYDPDGTNNDIDAGFAGLDIPYGLALSPDGTSLFYGTMDRRVMSIDLTATGGFPGTSSSVTVAGVNFDSFEDATETLHTTVADSANADLTLFISDLEFTPAGDLIIGTRSGCPAISDSGDFSNAFASSYNHDAVTFIVEDNGAGLFNANQFAPNVSYDTGGVIVNPASYGEPAQGNDGYGGVDYYVAPDGTFDYVFSFGDIIQESSPHGIAVFPSEDAADATPVNPLGGISYFTGTDGLLDVKGVGGDVQVYQQFSCPIVGAITGNVSQDTTGNGAGDTDLANVTISLFLDEDGDGLADGPAIATTTTGTDGNYSFNNLLANNYLVVETQPINLNNVSENEGGDDNDQVAATTENAISAVVDPGETDTGNDFVEEEGVCVGSTHTVTFDELPTFPLVDNGAAASTFVTNQYAGGAGILPVNRGFTVTATGVGTGQAALYNSNTGGADPDITGNTGNVLIVQENAGGVPDDSVGGILTFDFESPLVLFSATLVDFESPNSALVFTDSTTGTSVVVSYGDLVDPTSPFFQPGAVLGDGNNLNMPNPISAADLGLTNFDQVALDMSGVPTGSGATSGGIDNLVFSHDCGSWTGNVSEDVDNDGLLDDADDAPISGVTIQLFTDPNGDGDPADGVLVDTTTTGTNGDYVFNDVVPGDYVAVETQPGGFDDVIEDEGGVDNDKPDNGTVNSIAGTVDPGENDANNDFVERLTPLPVAIGSFVFEDTDGDGTQNDTVNGGFEPGIGGVSVQLFLSNGNPAVDLAGATVPLQTTGADGLYFFNNLPEGDYVVRVTPPATYVETINQVNADDQGFFDSNIAGETTPGSGVYVSPVITLTANGEGSEGGAPGDSQDNTNPGQNSGDTSVDFGFVELGSWTGNVSEDTTGDGNGDTPIPGVEIELFTDPNGDGDPADGVSVGTQTTNGAGDYTFTNLAPGDYVAVEDQGTVPSTLDNISEDEGGADNDKPDNSILNAVAGTVDSGETDANNDFVEGEPSIELIKSISNVDITAGGLPTFADAGDVVTYSFSVVNTGVTTLTDVTVTDSGLPGVTLSSAATANCTAGPLAPGATANCAVTASYTITGPDVTNGLIENTADVTADSESPVDGTPGTPVTDESDTGTTPNGPGSVDPVTDPLNEENNDEDLLPNDPTDPTDDPTVLTLVESGSWTGNVSEDTTGDGNGDTPIPGVEIELFTDPNGDGDPADGVSVGTQTTNGAGDYTFTNLAPGDYVAVEDQGTVPSTLDNISEDEGGADNDKPDNSILNAVAGTVDSGETDANNDFVEGEPSIELIKSISNVDITAGGLPTFADAGDVVTYSFSVVNTGVTTLTDVTVTDSGLPGVTLSSAATANCTAGPLAPGATANCAVTASYTITGPDVTNGLIENTADVTADSESPVDGTPGTPVTDESDTGTTPNGPGSVDPVTDPLNEENNDEDLLPNDPTDPTDDPTVLTLVESGSWTGNVSEDTTGDGNGDTPIPGVEIELFTDPNGDGDPADGVSVGTQTTNGAGDYTFTNLAPGDYVAVEDQGTVPSTLDNISEDEGGADNDKPDNSILNAVAGTVDSGETDANNDFVEGEPSIELIKSISNVDITAGGLPTFADAGDVVTYSFSVVNTGVTTLTDVTVTDSGLPGVTLSSAATANCTAGPLAPGATANCAVTASYTITGPDVTNGLIENTADVTADSESPVDGTPGTPVTDESDTGTTPNGPGSVDPVTDPLNEENNDEDLLPNDPTDPTDDPTVLTLVESGSWTGNVSEDTTGDGNGDTPIPGVEIELFTDPNGDGDPADGVSVGTQTTNGAGDYTFTNLAPGDYVAVEDQGTVPSTLDNISEDEGGADNDKPDNSILNAVAGTVDSGETDANNDFVEGEPSIELIKSISNVDITAGGLPTFADAGDVVTYSFSVVNTGVTTLTDVTVTDSGLPGVTLSSAATANCTAGPLAPGATANCAVTASYTITGPDVTNGLIENTADVTADSESPVDGTPGTPVTDESDTGTTPNGPGSVDPVTDPLNEENNDEDLLPNDPTDPTDDPTVLTLVESGSWTGNVSEDTTGDGNGDTPIPGVEIELFTDPNGDGDPADGVSVGTQTTNGAGDYTFTNLAPGDYVAVEDQGTVPSTLDNISEDEGGADNDKPDNSILNAVAGTVDSGETDANNDFVEGEPSIELIKSISNVDITAGGLPTFADAGDVVTYSFSVVNTGVTTLTDVTVTDSGLPGVTLSSAATANCTAGPLAPGATANCAVTASYTITGPDVTNGLIENTADVTADSESPVDGTPGTPVTDESDTGTTPNGPGSVDPVTDPLNEENNDEDLLPNDPTDPTDDPTVLTLEELGSIGDTVYLDWDADGVQDPGEPGIENVTVELMFPDNSTITTTTDSDGEYLFDNLPSGSYMVTVIPATLDPTLTNEGVFFNTGDPDNATSHGAPVDITAGDVNISHSNATLGDDKSTYVLGAGEDNEDQDFGYHPAIIAEDDAVSVFAIEELDECSPVTFAVGGAADANPETQASILSELGIDLIADGTSAGAATTVVDLDPSTSVIDNTLVVSGEGTWAYDQATDTLTFTPEDFRAVGDPLDDGYDCFEGTPTPLVYGLYELVDIDGNGSVDGINPVEGVDYSTNYGDEATLIFNRVTTPVNISYVQIEEGVSGNATIRWMTDMEAANVGFMLYQRTPKGWVELNETIIPSKSLNAIGSTNYEFLAQDVVGQWFAIADVDPAENVTVHGPYRLGGTYGSNDEAVEAVDWSKVNESDDSELDLNAIKSRIERLKKAGGQ